MGDVNIDENGNEIDESGTKKKGYAAESMNPGDLMKIVDNFVKEFNDATKELNRILDGEGFADSRVALEHLATVCTGGPHIEFARTNNHLLNNADKHKFYTSGGAISDKEKDKMLYFVIMVQKSTDFRRTFSKFLASCSSDWILYAYRAIRFEKKMKDLYTSSDMNSISNAFGGFGLLYKEYNNAKIFDKILVSKATHTQEEITETILDYLDADIQRKPHLTKYLSGAKASNASGLNTLHIYDRETSGFSDFASENAAFEKGIELCSTLDSMLAECYEVGTESLFGYFDAYKRIIDKVVEILKKALEVTENFVTKKDTAPYAIMHYDRTVKAVVEDFNLKPLSSPLNEGTNYCEVAADMVNRYRALAKNIAKFAPDNLPDED